MMPIVVGRIANQEELTYRAAYALRKPRLLPAMGVQLLSTPMATDLTAFTTPQAAL